MSQSPLFIVSNMFQPLSQQLGRKGKQIQTQFCSCKAYSSSRKENHQSNTRAKEKYKVTGSRKVGWICYLQGKSGKAFHEDETTELWPWGPGGLTWGEEKEYSRSREQRKHPCQSCATTDTSGKRLREGCRGWGCKTEWHCGKRLGWKGWVRQDHKKASCGGAPVDARFRLTF